MSIAVSDVTPLPVRTVRPIWVSPEPVDAAEIERLREELSLPPILCELLVRRGHRHPVDAKRFLRPRPEHLHGPELLVDIDPAADRIAAAVQRGETILVHGDYDVDGICATALLTRALGMMGAARIVPFVPHRLVDGYDLTEAGVKAAVQAGATLIVTADCGIVAHGAVEMAAVHGIDVVVTDHHTPGPTLPAASAVVNPKRSDCGYPGKELSGSGVAYKLAQAVAVRCGLPAERLHALLDLVAVATVADLMPVTGENRALLRWGLSILPKSPNPGLRALLKTCGLGDRTEITAGQVGFIVAPRLNAAGRLGSAMRGVRLLTTDDPAEAAALAAELEVENRRRRDLDEATFEEAMRTLERDHDPGRDSAVVLASDRWHAGVIGIVASRIVEQIHRPTVLIAIEGGEGKGSARSIPGFHLYDAIAACASHLVRFGGHRAAAGCSILPENIDAFRDSFLRVAEDRIAPEDYQPRLRVDAEVQTGDASLELAGILRHMGPFGMANPTPLLVLRNVRVTASPRIVGGRHVKFTVGDDRASLPAIAFGMADRLAELERVANGIDVAFRLEENRWTGRDGRSRTEAQARVVDFRSAG